MKIEEMGLLTNDDISNMSKIDITKENTYEMNGVVAAGAAAGGGAGAAGGAAAGAATK